MKLNTIGAAMRRRWWVVAGIMWITVFGVIWTVTNSARYEATAILLLADPALTGSASNEVPDEVPNEVPDEGDGSALHPAVVVEVVASDDTRESLRLTGSDIDYTITATENGIIRVETFADSETGLVATATALVGEVERIVAELDTADPLRTAEPQVLSEPRNVRQRTVVGADGTSQTQFYAVGSVLLQIDETLATENANPYTASDGTLRVLEEVASTEQVIEEVREDVGDGEAGFELVFQQRDAAPVVHVVASATTPESTMSTLDAAVGFLDAYLADRQARAGAPESTWLVLERLAVPREAQMPEGSFRRPVATIIVLGLIAAATLAVLIDSLVTSRIQEGESGNGMRADGQEQSSVDAAVAWLNTTLAEPRTRAAVMADRGAFSEGTIHRAAQRLGVISVRDENQKGRPATWSLPVEDDSEDDVSGESAYQAGSVYIDETIDVDETGDGAAQVADGEVHGRRRSS